MLCEEETIYVCDDDCQFQGCKLTPHPATIPCHHHAFRHSPRPGEDSSEHGRDGTSSVDMPSDEGTNQGTEGQPEGQSVERNAEVHAGIENGIQEESRPDPVCQGPPSDRGGERHHPSDFHKDGTSDLGQLSTDGSRDSGVRRTQPPHIPRVDETMPGLHPLVLDNLPGREDRLAHAALGEVGQDADGLRGRCSLEGCKRIQTEAKDPNENQSESVRVFNFIGSLLPGERGGDRPSQEVERRVGSAQAGEGGIDRGKGRDGTGPGSHEISPRDMSLSDDEEAPGEINFFTEKDKNVFKDCLPHHCQHSMAWDDVVRKGRPLLMEVACSENSILGQEVENRLGPQQRFRCSIWNGYDLTKQSGVEACKKLIKSERPQNVWISCDCGPFSPMQHVNQRNQQQKDNLERKRNYAIQEYLGGIQVAKFAIKQGCDVHWELSEKCEAWKLPCIDDFVGSCGLKKVTCHGCRVDLRTKDTQELLCKGWTIATTNMRMCEHMNLHCQRNHAHGVCDRGRAKHTAFYTPVFAKRVVDAMLEHDDWNQVAQDIHFGINTTQEGNLDDDHGEETQHGFVMSPAEKEKVLRNLKHIHSVTGHCSNKHLVDALKTKGVTKEIIDMAKGFQCPICEKMKKPDARLPASLEFIPKKWQVVQTDVADWHHPETNQVYKFVLFIDEGTRYRTGQLLPGKGAPFSDLKKAFLTHWVQHHGKPEILRYDPCGAWRSKAAEQYLSTEGIEPGEIPAEAHWRIGLVEVSIRILKDVLTALTKEFPEKPIDEIFSKAIWACNVRANYSGFSPLQHATGRSPDECGRLFQSKIEGIPVHAQQHADGGFGEMQKMMVVAETEFLRSQARHRISRAMQAGHRRQHVYSPGDLVFYWRVQVGKQDGGQPFRKGKFVGPARILATETRQTDQGLEPSDVFWLHRNGRLLKATSAQLRPASSRELAYEELQGPLQVPWSSTSICKEPNKHMYEDISHEVPLPEEYEQSWDDNTPLFRHTTKRPANFPLERPRNIPKKDDPDMDLQGNEETQLCYWSEECNMVSMEINMPTSNRQMKTFMRDPIAYVVSKLKKKQVEVKEHALTPAERSEFQKSKDKEVRNFIRESCLEALPKHLQPSPEVAMRMRWLLVWKWDDEGNKKAKARIVVQGYQDPHYEYREVSAPVVSRSGRQCFLQLCANKKLTVTKGDVTGAFLQGDIYSDQDLLCVPPEELCLAMNIPPKSICRLRKAAYGLVQAPLYWYKTVCRFLEEIGYRRLLTDPCIWVFYDSNKQLRSAICAHVDDFVFAGKEGDMLYNELIEKIKKRFTWGSWESSPFIQCGTKISQNKDFSFDLTQEAYLKAIHEIPLSRDRARQSELATTEGERSQMRSILGALSWFCGQVGFLYSADVGFLISAIPKSTIQDVITLNKLVNNSQ